MVNVGTLMIVIRISNLCVLNSLFQYCKSTVLKARQGYSVYFFFIRCRNTVDCQIVRYIDLLQYIYSLDTYKLMSPYKCTGTLKDLAYNYRFLYISNKFYWDLVNSILLWFSISFCWTAKDSRCATWIYDNFYTLPLENIQLHRIYVAYLLRSIY
jgi:hypothetical protein